MKKKVENIDPLAKCSVCEKFLDPKNVVIIDEKEQKTVLHATCLECQSASMVFLSGNQSGIVTVGMATDLDAQEAKIMIGREAISADEIIDLHQLVLDKNTDMVKLVESI